MKFEKPIAMITGLVFVWGTVLFFVWLDHSTWIGIFIRWFLIGLAFLYTTIAIIPKSEDRDK